MEFRECNLAHLFPTTLYSAEYKSNMEEEKKFVNNLEYIKNGVGNKKSKDTYILNRPELNKINTFIKGHLKNFLENGIKVKNDLIVTQSWVNKNEPGTGHSTHLHPNSIVSGTFCLRQNSTMPPTQYYNRYIPLIKVQMESQNSMNAEHISVPMVPGDLILFPSDIMHSVSVNVSNETRYSLSFNTFSNELGSN